MGNRSMRLPGQPVLLSIMGGMMAAAFLHSRSVVDFSFGFPSGGLEEGAIMAATGGVSGYAVLFVFRLLRKLTKRPKP